MMPVQSVYDYVSQANQNRSSLLHQSNSSVSLSKPELKSSGILIKKKGFYVEKLGFFWKRKKSKEYTTRNLPEKLREIDISFGNIEDKRGNKVAGNRHFFLKNRGKYRKSMISKIHVFLLQNRKFQILDGYFGRP